jgi:hypothetical protein
MSKSDPNKPAINERGFFNTRPIVWTKKKVLEELEILLNIINEDKSICFIKGAIASRPYIYETLAEKIHIYRDDNKIPYAYRKIMQILENRSISLGLNKTHDSAITKFHLINNFKYQDKQVIDQNHTLTKVKDEELREDLAKELANISD